MGEWKNVNLPNDVRKGPDGNFYVAELDHRISILDSSGNLLSRWGDTEAIVDDSETGSGLPDSASRNPMIIGKVKHEPGAGLFGAPHGSQSILKGVSMFLKLVKLSSESTGETEASRNL